MNHGGQLHQAKALPRNLQKLRQVDKNNYGKVTSPVIATTTPVPSEREELMKQLARRFKPAASIKQDMLLKHM